MTQLMRIFYCLLTFSLVGFSSSSFSFDLPAFNNVLEKAKEIGSLTHSTQIPGLDKILKRPEAIEGDLHHTYRQTAILDRYEPQQIQKIHASQIGKDGKIHLTPGVYEYIADSYCLGIGRGYGGYGGGYLIRPTEGKQQRYLKKIMHNSAHHPEIEQSLIQELVWAIISYSKINSLRPEVREVAAKLLNSRDIFQLNGGALAVIPESLRSAAMAKIPANVRNVMQAETKIRSLLTGRVYSYRQLVEIAVPKWLPSKHFRGPHVPLKRWTVHPDGYFIRVIPSRFSKSKIQMIVPEPYQIVRDSQGRITSMKGADGFSIETLYEDHAIANVAARKLGLRIFAFKTLRMQRPISGHPGKFKRLELRNVGFTFVHKNAGAQNAEGSHPLEGPQLAALGDIGNLGLFAQTGSGRRVEGLVERLRQAKEIHDRYQEEVGDHIDYYRERLGNARSAATHEDIERLQDQEHYRDGIDAALRGSTADRLEWIVDNQERQNRALSATTQLIERLPTTSSVDVDPGGLVAVPSGGQALGLSSRSDSLDPSPLPRNTGSSPSIHNYRREEWERNNSR